MGKKKKTPAVSTQSDYQAIARDIAKDYTMAPSCAIRIEKALVAAAATAPAAVQRGLADAAAGRVKDLGSFAQYAEESIQAEKQDLSTCTTCKGAIDPDDKGLIVQDSKPYHGSCVAKSVRQEALEWTKEYSVREEGFDYEDLIEAYTAGKESRNAEKEPPFEERIQNTVNEALDGYRYPAESARAADDVPCSECGVSKAFVTSAFKADERVTELSEELVKFKNVPCSQHKPSIQPGCNACYAQLLDGPALQTRTDTSVDKAAEDYLTEYGRSGGSSWATKRAFLHGAQFMEAKLSRPVTCAKCSAYREALSDVPTNLAQVEVLLRSRGEIQAADELRTYRHELSDALRTQHVEKGSKS